MSSFLSKKKKREEKEESGRLSFFSVPFLVRGSCAWSSRRAKGKKKESADGGDGRVIGSHAPKRCSRPDASAGGRSCARRRALDVFPAPRARAHVAGPLLPGAADAHSSVFFPLPMPRPWARSCTTKRLSSRDLSLSLFIVFFYRLFLSSFLCRAFFFFSWSFSFLAMTQFSSFLSFVSPCARPADGVGEALSSPGSSSSCCRALGERTRGPLCEPMRRARERGRARRSTLGRGPPVGRTVRLPAKGAGQHGKTALPPRTADTAARTCPLSTRPGPRARDGTGKKTN